MSPEKSGIFWSSVGLYTCITTFNFWAASQGGDLRIPSLVEIKSEGRSAAVYGLLVVVPMYALFLYLTWELLGKRTIGRLSRLPRAFGIALNTKNRLQRRLTAAWVALLMAFPLAGVVHFENKMLNGTLIVSPSRQAKLLSDGVAVDRAMCLTNDATYGCVVADDAPSHLFRLSAVPALLTGEYENAFQYDPVGCGEPTGPCKGLTFFPFFEPWLLLLSGCALFALWFAVLRKILAPRTVPPLAQAPPS